MGRNHINCFLLISFQKLLCKSFILQRLIHFVINLKVSFIFVAVKIGFNITIGRIAFVSYFLFFVESGASRNLSDTGASMGCIYKLKKEGCCRKFQINSNLNCKVQQWYCRPGRTKRNNISAAAEIHNHHVNFSIIFNLE